MKITFCGANREVTGSCYHIETEHANIVLDCGMFQGGRYAEEKNRLDFPFDPAKVTTVILTHAHFDHVGRLPKLYKDGFRGKIYCTAPTSELAMITLRDSVHLMKEEAERHDVEPLFTADEVEPLEKLGTHIPYHEQSQIAPGVSVYLSDAGHILGSSSIRLLADGQSAVFSGDLGNTPVPLLKSVECLTGADLVIGESTYGNRVHEGHDERTAFLRKAIQDAVRTQGTLLIPAFALERTQELLYELHRLHSSGQIPNLPIFLDSPMAIAATDVFRHHLDFMDIEARQDTARLGGDLFQFSGLRSTVTSDESKHILNVHGPKVIIAGSGMMNGGRIMHHLKNYLGHRNTILLIIGYQVEGSVGRQLHEGAKRIHIYGQEIHVHADVRSCGSFSGHADYPRLMNWLHCFQAQPPKAVYVTHGELNSALSFSQSVEDELGIVSAVPEFSSIMDLGQILAQK